MEYQDHVAALTEQHPDLGRELSGLRTLERVLGWMKQRGLQLGTLDLVTKDEYSHDLLIPLDADGRFLVFGVT